jgi:hypothetical protein
VTPLFSLSSPTILKRQAGTLFPKNALLISVVRLPVRFCLGAAILCIIRGASQKFSHSTVGDIRPLSMTPFLFLSQLVEGISVAPPRQGPLSDKRQTIRKDGTQSHGSGNSQAPDGRATEESWLLHGQMVPTGAVVTPSTPQTESPFPFWHPFPKYLPRARGLSVVRNVGQTSSHFEASLRHLTILNSRHDHRLLPEGSRTR